MRVYPFNRRNLFSADIATWNISARRLSREKHPLARSVRCRIVAKVDSIGLVVRIDTQWAAGKS